MSKAIATIVLILTFSLVGSNTLRAENRLALVIGNGAYTVGPLDNPANDASLMADTLRSAGFDVTHAEDLAYRDLQRAVVQFGRTLSAAGPDTVGMVYYAGHAVQANGENYLIPVDADIRDELDLDIQTLQVSVLMRGLERAGNRLNMVVLDACRNNPFKSVSRSGARGLAKVDAPYGTLLAYSTAPGDVATDGNGRNSPYTTALSKAIRTPGVPVEQVFKRVRIEVMERTGNQQVPWESSSLTGDFYFLDSQPVVTAPAPTPEPSPQSGGADKEVEFWKSIAASDDPGVFESYLQTYPNGIFAGLARQRIAGLAAAREEDVKRRAEQDRLAQAALLWDAVKDSDDPAMFQTVVDQHPGSLYAQLAQVKLEALRQQAAAPAGGETRSVEDGSDSLFWQSIQNSTAKADYLAYLDKFPNGTFAAIARNRAENGYQPQVASLNDTGGAHPYDGVWLVTWKVAGGYSSSTRWCGAGEKGTTEILIKNGEFNGPMRSNYSGTAYVKILVSEAGGVRFRAKVPGWSVGTIANRFTMGDDGFSETLKASGYCRATLEMRRP